MCNPPRRAALRVWAKENGRTARLKGELAPGESKETLRYIAFEHDKVQLQQKE